MGPVAVPVFVRIRRLLASDLVRSLASTSVPFPSDLVPVMGVVFDGTINTTLVVVMDTSDASPYVARGRTALAPYGTRWIDPAGICIGDIGGVASTVEDVFVTAYACRDDAIIVVADPRETKDRVCPSGKYGCDCDSDSEWSLEAPHRILYVVSVFMHSLASAMDFRFKAIDTSILPRGIGYVCLIIAASLTPMGDMDTSRFPRGIDDRTFLFSVPIVLGAVAAIIFAVGSYKRGRARYMPVTTGWTWVGYDAASNETKKVPVQALARLLHQGFLAGALAAAVGLVWTTASVAAIPILVGAVLEVFSSHHGRGKLAYGLSRVLIIAGLLLCGAALSMEPCGSSYGADRPASSI
jgi:hypothetical protein